jgi:hypothetical protein
MQLLLDPRSCVQLWIAGMFVYGVQFGMSFTARYVFRRSILMAEPLCGGWDDHYLFCWIDVR